MIVAAIGIPIGIVVIVAVALIIYFLSGKGGSPSTEPFMSRSPATEELQKQFEKVFTKCGDSYYANQLFWGGLGQFKDVTFSTQELPLNEADKAMPLNGKERAKLAVDSYDSIAISGGEIGIHQRNGCHWYLQSANVAGNGKVK